MRVLSDRVRKIDLARLVNGPQGEGLSRLEAWILAVNEIKLTVATKAGERFVLTELQGVE